MRPEDAYNIGNNVDSDKTTWGTTFVQTYLSKYLDASQF